MFDCGVVVSALGWSGNPRFCLDLVYAGQVCLCVTTEIWEEYGRKVPEVLAVHHRQVDAEVELAPLLRVVRFVQPVALGKRRGRDPEDERYHASGGDYGGAAGKLAPAGAIVVFGDYNIQVENNRSHARPHADETILIHYESGFPISADSDGVMTFQCALTHPEWGWGRARGVVEGKTIRNILSFPSELP